MIEIFLSTLALVLMLKMLNKQQKQKYKKTNSEPILKEYKYKNIYQEKDNENKKSINMYESFYKNKKMSFTEKKEKGDKYEKHVANVLREQGYYVWEHGKEKGFKDSGVDLLIKKDEYIYFVQCKDWEKWKLDHNTVQAIQTKIRNFLKKEDGIRNITNGYKQKILYVTSKKCLTPGAYKYIKEHNDILEYKVIPIET